MRMNWMGPTVWLICVIMTVSVITWEIMPEDTPAYTIEEAGWTRISKHPNGPLMAISFHGVAAEEEAVIVLGFGKPDRNGQGSMYYRLATAEERAAWAEEEENQHKDIDEYKI